MDQKWLLIKGISLFTSFNSFRFVFISTNWCMIYTVFMIIVWCNSSYYNGLQSAECVFFLTKCIKEILQTKTSFMVYSFSLWWWLCSRYGRDVKDNCYICGTLQATRCFSSQLGHIHFLWLLLKTLYYFVQISKMKIQKLQSAIKLIVYKPVAY